MGTSQGMTWNRQGAIGHIDINNMYVSCERLFNPKLKNKPVVVLSNNDACVISRSDEARFLGVKLGEPWFKLIERIPKSQLVALSSNYTLYADLSNRVMETLQSLLPFIEVYSIDEAFLDFSGFTLDALLDLGPLVAKTVTMNLGLPVSLGIAPTKTLAKVATKLVKQKIREPEKDIWGLRPDSTCNLYLFEEKIDKILATFQKEDLWGISRGLGNRLEQFQIRTACDLKYLEPVQARKTGGIVLEKTVNELNGIRGLNILNLPKPRKQLRSSRQFGIPVFKLEDLKEGLLLYATQVVNRLRKENFETSSIVVELSTGTLNAQNLIYANAYRTKLDDPTDNLLVIYKTAEKGLENIYRPGYKYKRVGIWLEELSPKDSRQLSLFSGSSPSSPLDASVEKIKAKLANVTIGFGDYRAF